LFPESKQPVDADLVPPKEMLHDGSSSPEEFVDYGDGFVQYILVPRARLVPSAAIFDLGCGNGSVARALTRFLSPSGRYEGVDVHAPAIAWLQERYRSHRNFKFTHANVYNKMYNPDGQLPAGEYRFPFDDASFDLILLKSVFTHMLPVDVRTYMHEISRVLRPGGRSIITYFLLNDESRRFVALGLDANGLKFDYAADPLCRVANPDMPEAVVAHDEGRMREYYADVDCSVQEIAFGNWCGRQSQIGHQDLIIAAKEP